MPSRSPKKAAVRWISEPIAVIWWIPPWSEISAGIIQKDYQFEEEELKNKFIEYNMGTEAINSIFKALNDQNRSSKILDFIRLLMANGITTEDIVLFLKSLSIEDLLITRIMSSIGVANG